MKRVCRRPQFEISLDIRDEKFISTPAASQQNWVLSRAMDELADDLSHLNRLAKEFVAGSKRQVMRGDWVSSVANYEESQLIIDGQQVMQDWERPYMEAMALAATESHGDLLEVGFGMGISADYIQGAGVRSHTIIECNEDVIERFTRWKSMYPGRDIRLVKGRWQDTVHQLSEFDSIFFDTYPLSEKEFSEFVVADVTFAAHFFEAAAMKLKRGGVLTYYSNEIDTMSRRHQRRLLKYFKRLSMSVVQPLYPPDDCNYWWANSMVLVSATK